MSPARAFLPVHANSVTRQCGAMNRRPPQRMNVWLRFGLPALVVFGLGYAVRAADDTEYATEGLHRVLVIAAFIAVVIGLLTWMGEKR